MNPVPIVRIVRDNTHNCSIWKSRAAEAENLPWPRRIVLLERLQKQWLNEWWLKPAIAHVKPNSRFL